MLNVEADETTYLNEESDMLRDLYLDYRTNSLCVSHTDGRELFNLDAYNWVVNSCTDTLTPGQREDLNTWMYFNIV